MIKLYCDLCKKQVKELHKGSAESGPLGDLYVAAKVEEMCEKCFIKADQAKLKAQKEADRFFAKRMAELLKLDDKGE